MTNHPEDILERIDLRFRSGRSLNAERAHMLASEWDELRTAISGRHVELEELPRLRAQVLALTQQVAQLNAKYSGLTDKMLALVNAIPRLKRYKGEYLWPMNPPRAEVAGLVTAMSQAALFIDANPRVPAGPPNEIFSHL